MHQIKHSNTSRLSLHFKVLSQSYKSFPTSPIRNAAHGSIISSTNITISAKGGRFYPIDLSGKPETAITTLRCEEQTGRVGGQSYKCQREKTAKRSDGARTRTTYQTDAGDAGVVGDVGDVQDFSFVVAAGRGTCEGRREGDTGEMRTSNKLVLNKL